MLGASNPYALLSLPASASGREIRRRCEELSVQAALTVTPRGAGEEAIKAACLALDDPARRARARFFWLLSPSASAPPDLRDQVAVAALLRRLDAAARSRDDEAPLARHDAAVVRLAQFMADPSRTDRLEPALADWVSLEDDDEFWDALGEATEDIADPRTAAALTALRSEYVFDTVDLIVDGAQSQSDDTLRRIVVALRESSLGEADAAAAAARLLAPARREAEDAVAEFTASVTALDDMRSGLAHSARLAALDMLDARVRPAVARYRALDPDGIDPSLLETYGFHLAKLGMGFVNIGQDEPELAISLVEEALGSIQSSTGLASMAEARANLRKGYHLREAEALGQHRDTAAEIAHLEMVEEFLGPEERHMVRQKAMQLRQGMRVGGLQRIAESRARIERGIADAQDTALGRTRPEDVPVASSSDSPPPALPSPPLAVRRRPGRGKLWWVLGTAAIVVAVLIWNQTRSDATPDKPLTSAQAEATRERSAAWTAAAGRPTRTPTRTATRTPAPSPTPDQGRVIDSIILEGLDGIVSTDVPGEFAQRYSESMTATGDYSWTAVIRQMSSSGSVVLGLDSTADDTTEWAFAFDLSTRQWSAYWRVQNGDLDTYIEPVSFAQVPGDIESVSVRVVGQVPSVWVNGVNVTAGVPMPRMPVRASPSFGVYKPFEVEGTVRATFSRVELRAAPK